MQAYGFDSCLECSTTLLDAGDELVCPNCGVVKEKQVAEAEATDTTIMPILTRQALGSYMGSIEPTRGERFSRGVAGSNSRYEYLKAVSDFAGRSEGAAISCSRMIERVAEKLLLPRVVILQAASIARKVFAADYSRRRVTVPSVSAYSLIAACKIEGVTSVSVREVIGAHVSLGRKVSSSSVIQLALESPVKTFARRPEEYLTHVLARLSLNWRLCESLRVEGVSQTCFFNSLRETAREILRLADEGTMAGRRPCALAASAIYSAEMANAICESRRKRVTQRDLAECGDAAEYTIREQCARIFTPAVQMLLTRRSRTLLPAS